MPRGSMLLLAIGMIGGGCSTDAPITAPDVAVAEVVAAKSADTKDKDRSTDGAFDDALQRLLPALGDYGIPLRAPLLALQTRATDQLAWDGLLQALDAVARTLPEEYLPDFDALRLQLDAAATQ